MPFLINFFHLPWCFQGSSILQQVSVLISFLWTNNIPLYGHFVCFQFLTIISNALMNICIQIFLCGHMLLVLLGIYLRVDLVRHAVSSVFNFWRNSQTVCQSSYTTYDPVSSLWGFHFLHILTTPCHYLPFWCGLPRGHEVISYCDFDLHIPDG